MTIEVPDFVGWTVRDAFNEVVGDELVVTFATDPGGFKETTEALGKEICDQLPRAGETVARGTTVLVAIPDSDGTCPDLDVTVEVPELVGLTMDLATSLVSELGLSTLVYGSSEPTSVVCSQVPEAGELINVGEGVTVQAVAPGGCEEMLNPNGLYARTYVDYRGFEWFGTDCPAADVLKSGGHGDGLPQATDTTKARVDQLLLESGSDLAEPGVISFQSLPRSGKVWDLAENGDVVVFDGDDDYMIKVTKDASFACPSAPYFWNGIPVAFVNS